MGDKHPCRGENKHRGELPIQRKKAKNEFICCECVILGMKYERESRVRVRERERERGKKKKKERKNAPEFREYIYLK